MIFYTLDSYFFRNRLNRKCRDRVTIHLIFEWLITVLVHLTLKSLCWWFAYINSPSNAGKSNRRYFCLFTFPSTVTCFCCSRFSDFYCRDEGDRFVSCELLCDKAWLGLLLPSKETLSQFMLHMKTDIQWISLFFVFLLAINNIDLLLPCCSGCIMTK